jgi:hypothetical protein
LHAIHLTETAAAAPLRINRMIAAIADGEREAGLGVGVDQDRKYRQVIFRAIALADRNAPLSCRFYDLPELRRNNLPVCTYLTSSRP